MNLEVTNTILTVLVLALQYGLVAKLFKPALFSKMGKVFNNIMYGIYILIITVFMIMLPLFQFVLLIVGLVGSISALILLFRFNGFKELK